MEHIIETTVLSTSCSVRLNGTHACRAAFRSKNKQFFCDGIPKMLERCARMQPIFSLKKFYFLKILQVFFSKKKTVITFQYTSKPIFIGGQENTIIHNTLFSLVINFNLISFPVNILYYYLLNAFDIWT